MNRQTIVPMPQLKNVNKTFNNSSKCYTYCRCRIWLSFTLGRDLGIALWWWLSITWVAWFLGSLYFPLVPGIDWRWWGWHKLDRILSVHRWEWTLGLILTLLPTRENFLGVVGFFTVFSGSPMGRTYNITIIYNSNFLQFIFPISHNIKLLFKLCLQEFCWAAG